jgi:putative ABC transport system permease protein
LLTFLFSPYDIGSSFGIFFASPILDIVIALIAATLVLMLRDRITSRLAIHNVSRRKVTLALVILGLLIGTAMISGSLVTSDSINTLFTRGAYYSFGAVDEGIYHTDLAGNYVFFNSSIYDQYRSNLLSIPNVKGVTPMIITSASLFDNRTKVGQPGVVLIGVDPNATSVLGNFQDSSGNIISPNIGDNGMIINTFTARDLNATVGDTITIYSGGNASSFIVRGIDDSFARSGFPGQSDNSIITLDSAQSLLGKQGTINFIAITNVGGIQNSIAYTQQVGGAANTTLSSAVLGGGNRLYAFGDKNATVVSQSQNAQSLGSIFLVLSVFTIVAGSVLIVNIFVMLAEERKKELGMARAVGMKRMHLTKLFLFEGLNYSLLSSFIGVFAGIGIAYAILYLLGVVLTPLIPTLNNGEILQSFTVNPTALLTSFSAGFLITYLTIAIASWRVSKLNIIRAIRDIPEPPHSVRTYTRLLILGVVVSVLGFIFYFEGKSSVDPTLFLLGPALLIFGVGLILARFLKNQYAFTISSIAILVYWAYPPFSWNNPATPSLGGNNNLGPFIAGGIFMVVSGVILVAFNTDVIMKGITFLFRFRTKSIPVLKIGMSYPGAKKFRTAITIFMFALIMFVVVAISIIITLSGSAVRQDVVTSTGGYDLVAISSTPINNLESMVRSDSNVSSSIQSVVAFNGVYTLVKDLRVANSNSSVMLYVGANASTVGSDNFFQNNEYNLTSATSNFIMPNGKVNIPKVWNDIVSNSSDVVFSTTNFGGPGQQLSGSNQILAGDQLGILLPNGTMSKVTVVAIMNGITISGIVTTTQAISERLHVNTSNYALISLKSSGNANSIAINLKRDFLKFGLQIIVVETIVNEIISIQQSFFSVLQGFLGLGLVVGIAGLGIISVRSVIERRQEIGMLRALGFKRLMILGSFLLENSFVALLGIFIGALVAIDFGYAIDSSSSGISVAYFIPWMNILEVCTAAYIFAILATAWSALRASRTLPAQALRYIE